MKPRSLIQIVPPSPIMCLTMERQWNLLGIGSQHGMVLYDKGHNRVVHKLFTPSHIVATTPETVPDSDPKLGELLLHKL
ncbi:hypothetical protein Ciccas_004680 [Cichlidogyrus casuarinus]|uniref:Uncharacterized protein n=1 Tax=Cichlidogyrus casuarinus TaxID=1844966 RepID=A0ABD2QB82_9PLAT